MPTVSIWAQAVERKSYYYLNRNNLRQVVKSSLWLLLYIKFYWDTAIPIHLSIQFMAAFKTKESRVATTETI